jgi:hypothetical protein
MRNPIFLTERNIHGAWVIYGVLGVKQYYYYTKAEAMRKYREEANRTELVNVR